MGTKMKGLLKGLRYISQIFADNEKEEEIQIGLPTDVKHVGHIGWEGSSAVQSPSWMNEFKSPGSSPAPPNGPGGDSKQASPVNCGSEDSGQRGNRDLPGLPKPSRPKPSAGASSVDSPKSDRTSKSRQSRRNQAASASSSPAREPNNGGTPTWKPMSPGPEPKSAALKSPDLPKKSRRKKSKDSGGGGSTRSRPRSQAPVNYTSPFSDPGSGSGSGSGSKFNDSPRSPLKRNELVEKRSVT